jgi:hypothetical protein
MFELSKHSSIKLEILEGSKIYIIDNFYEHPDSIVEYFLSIKPELWKSSQTATYNSLYFEDRKHFIESSEIEKVYDFLSFLCDQESYRSKNIIVTNATRFKKHPFNNYKDNYWWPHTDFGYNALVYLNVDDNISGTNLYENLNPKEEPPMSTEHFAPWRPKSNFRLIKTLIPRYNRLVLFDGLKFFHGMHICNDDYFGENYRFNQVFAFVE